MSHNDSHITTLFKKYLAGTVTVQEMDELLTYFGLDEHTEVLKTMVQEQFDQHLATGVDPARVDAMVGVMDETVLKLTAPISQPLRLWRTFATRALPYAAAILLTMSVGLWLYLDTKQQRAGGEPTIVDVAPGGNRAMLTLADGRNIVLDAAQSGIVISDEHITYQGGVDLVMLSAKDGKEEGLPAETFTLNTPRGGQYRVTLPDGTEVWLNSASTLKYPARFNDNERVVEITGEGYFSVAHDQKRPFRVLSKGQVVEVLGTEFNISAYPDESEIKTTLVGGSVQVTPTTDHRLQTVIKPGQQSKLKNGNISVDDVNIDPYIAWKSGMFHFKHTPFVDMMHQIERWYDVEVIYNNKIPQDTFSGRMRRDVSLLTVLDLLKVSEISFHIEEKKLIIE